MLKNLIIFSLLLFTVSFTAEVKAANDAFICNCLAKAPGVDNKAGEKICSYSCNCTAFNQNETPKQNIRVSVDSVASSGRSRETWDIGSHICHGQYSFKPKLDDANWKIQVRFSPFTIMSYNSDVTFDDQPVEIALGIRYYIKRTPTAPEIHESLRNQL